MYSRCIGPADGRDLPALFGKVDRPGQLDQAVVHVHGEHVIVGVLMDSKMRFYCQRGAFLSVRLMPRSLNLLSDVQSDLLRLPVHTVVVLAQNDLQVVRAEPEMCRKVLITIFFNFTTYFQHPARTVTLQTLSQFKSLTFRKSANLVLFKNVV